MPPEFSPEIHKAISVPRLATYLSLAGNGSLEDALLLYRLNAKLSGAFLFPIQSAEVILRNAIASQLDAYFGVTDWLINVPDPTNRNIWSARQLKKIADAEMRLRILKNRTPTQNTMIADLEFGFWTEFLDQSRHRLWPHIRAAFPNLPAHARRGPVLLDLSRLRRLRNRIAHHEVIINHAGSPTAIHDLFIKVIGWMSPDKSAWTERHSQVEDVWREISDEKTKRGWTGF